MKFYFAVLIVVLGCTSSSSSGARAEEHAAALMDTLVHLKELYAPLEPAENLSVGAARFDKYLPLLLGKRIGVVANHTSLVDQTHLVDTLLSLGVNVAKVFAPEHGFRGDAANGEKIENGVDGATGLPVISLYGSNKKPTPEMLKNLDVLVFDIQDVGARFYTYISTMHYVMEAAAELDKEVVVLDRPNPNGFYVDWPVLDLKYQSFVGMHPIPVVHGLTVGELAQMILGEKWLANGVECKLAVIPCEGYTHRIKYELSVPPSPNLASMASVYLYPSLCFFEPTKVSVGRGTPNAFEIIGYPNYKIGSYGFTPISIPGKSVHPKYEGEACFGHNLEQFASFYFFNERMLYLDWLVQMYAYYPDKDSFFTLPEFFDKLCGTDQIRTMMEAGNSAEEIRESWSEELKKFKSMRKKYLLYVDFE